MNILQKYHQEDWHTPAGRLMRDVIFGLNDGLVTSIGFVSGVTGAVIQSHVVVLTGIAQLVEAMAEALRGVVAEREGER